MVGEHRQSQRGMIIYKAEQEGLFVGIKEFEAQCEKYLSKFSSLIRNYDSNQPQCNSSPNEMQGHLAQPRVLLLPSSIIGSH